MKSGQKSSKFLINIKEVADFKILFFLIIFYFVSFNLFSKTSLSFNDTLINRGVISQIPLYGSLTETNVTSLSIVVEFNALLLDIKSVITDTNCIMKCPKTVPKIVMDNISNSSMTITCNNVQTMSNGVYCILNIEGLARADSTTIIKPVKVIINGQEKTDVEFRPGEITIPGMPVYQTYPEDIGNNYPNPFFEETKFPISIHEPTKVKFYIYTNDGRFILSNEQPNDMLKLSFYKDKVEVPISNLNQKLDKGFYILKLSPDNMRFASGEYYLIMVTSLGVYYKNFMYFK